MQDRKRIRLLRRMVLGFAVALVAVPVAQAHPFEGSTPSQGYFKDTIGSSSYIAPEQSGRPLPVRGEIKAGIDASPGGLVLVGDDKRGIRTPTSGIVLVGDGRDLILTDYPSAVAAEAARSYGPARATPQVVTNPSDGFDWGDAGIGAGAIFAVMLLGAGVLLATQHVGRPAHV